jgi:hypothetical protein
MMGHIFAKLRKIFLCIAEFIVTVSKNSALLRFFLRSTVATAGVVLCSSLLSWLARWLLDEHSALLFAIEKIRDPVCAVMYVVFLIRDCWNLIRSKVLRKKETRDKMKLRGNAWF